MTGTLGVAHAIKVQPQGLCTQSPFSVADASPDGSYSDEPPSSPETRTAISHQIKNAALIVLVAEKIRNKRYLNVVLPFVVAAFLSGIVSATVVHLEEVYESVSLNTSRSGLPQGSLQGRAECQTQCDNG